MSDVFKAMVAAFYNEPCAVTYVSDGDGDEREVSLSEWAVEQGMKAAFAATEAAGYVLVPKDATPAMIAAGHLRDPLACDVEDTETAIYGTIWRAMVEATQTSCPSKAPSSLYESSSSPTEQDSERKKE